jgi:hypothetical protein
MKRYVTAGKRKRPAIILIPEPGEAVYHGRWPRTKKARRKQAEAMAAELKALGRDK